MLPVEILTAPTRSGDASKALSSEVTLTESHWAYCSSVRVVAAAVTAIMMTLSLRL